MAAKLSIYNESTTPHNLTTKTGLADGELALGKYVNVWISDNVRDLANDLDMIDTATLRIYYSAFDLDGTPGKNGLCDEPNDIDENTLCLYVWDEGQQRWTRLSDDLDWVNSITVDTANVQAIDTEFEGCVTAETGHLSLFALAGQPRTVSITGTTPASGDISVPIDQPVKISYDGYVLAGDLTDVTIEPEVKDVSATLDENTNTLIIEHARFKPKTTYTVTIPAGAIKSISGNPFQEYSWSFITGTPDPSSNVIKPGEAGTTDLTDSINQKGIITRQITAYSEDKLVELNIGGWTTCLTRKGQPLTKIKINEMSTPPPLPEYSDIVGLAYDFQPDGATFDPPVTLSFHYNPRDIPEGVDEENLVLAFWDNKSGSWVKLDCTCDPVNHIITAQVSHFTGLAILASTRPASFALENLIISPPEIITGQNINISVSIKNNGDLDGEKEIVLRINGQEVDSQKVKLGGQVETKVTFSLTPVTAGEYTAEIGGLTTVFTVKAVEETPVPPTTGPASEKTPEPSATKPVTENKPEPPAKPTNWSLILIIIAAAVIALFITGWYIKKKRRV